VADNENHLYDPGRQGFLDGSIDWDTVMIKAALVRGTSFNPAHSTLSQVGGTTAATSGAFTGKTVTNGVAYASPITFTAVTTSSAEHYIVIYQAGTIAVPGTDAGNPAVQRLICWLGNGNGIPGLHPNGNDINVTFDTGPNGIFKL